MERDARSRPSTSSTSRTPRATSTGSCAQLIPEAPAVKQAEAKLLQARRDLDQAELNLRYCDVVSEIDGVVTRRNVNPGNNVQVGQSLMAVRSLTEIWIDANFKETQLADLRIGQRVRCEVDMYGSRQRVRGPHHRLHHGDRPDPVPAAAAERHGQLREDRPAAAGADRADRLRPGQGPLFVGLSVDPYVYYKEPPTGPHAGEVLQPLRPLPQGPTASDAEDASQPAAPSMAPAAEARRQS